MICTQFRDLVVAVYFANTKWFLMHFPVKSTYDFLEIQTQYLEFSQMKISVKITLNDRLNLYVNLKQNRNQTDAS